MKLNDLIPLGFLVFGGFFVYSLLKNIWSLITSDKKNEKMSMKSLSQHFSLTIISVILLFLFIAFIVPKAQ